MKFKPEKKYFALGLTIFLTTVAIFIAYYLFFKLDTIKGTLGRINKILAPVFYGFVLAYLMSPLLNLLEKKLITPWFKKNHWIKDTVKRKKAIRTISILLTVIFVLFIIYLFFASVVPQVYQSLVNLISQSSVYSQNLMSWLNDFSKSNPEFDTIAKEISPLIYSYSNEADNFLQGIALPAINRFLMPNINSIIGSLSSGIVKAVMFLWNIIIGLIISVYVLAAKEKFASACTRLCYAFFNTVHANKIIEGVRFVHHTFIGFLGGKITDSAIIGVLCYICCLFMGMPYALLISVIVGVTNVIPFFGPYIGAIPSILIILLVDPQKALIFAIFILVLQQFDGNFLGPLILSQSTGVTSFWIIFAITLFGGLWSVLGMIIGVPVIVIILTAIEIATSNMLAKKNLPVYVSEYNSLLRITPEGEFIYIPHTKHEKKRLNKKNKALRFLNALGGYIKTVCIFIVNLIKSLYRKIRYYFVSKKLDK